MKPGFDSQHWTHVSPKFPLLFCASGLVLLFAVSSLRAQPQAPAPLFVDPGAPNGGDGSTWQHAFNTLDSALAGVLNDGALYVKQGVYSPGSSSGFQVTKRVAIYGGFAGTETSLAQRAGGTTTLNGGGSATHVVRIANVIGTPGVLLDRLEIKGGHAYGASSPDDSGAGICSTDSDLDLVDCLFGSNDSKVDGGAIYFSGSAGATRALHAKSCDFENNRTGNTTSGAVGNGGGIWGSLMTGLIVNTKFGQNSAEKHGGAVYLEYLGSGSNLLEFHNCSFWKNHANSTSVSLGGALYLGDLSSQTTGANAVLRGCTLADNYSNNCASGQAMYCSQYSVGKAFNSIFYYNYGSCSSSTAPLSGLTAVSYCDVEGGWGAPGNTNISSNPQFVGHLTGRLALSSSSPCIDVGDGDELPHDLLDLDADGQTTTQQLPYDLGWNTRTVDIQGVSGGVGTPAYLDMGAYEYHL